MCVFVQVCRKKLPRLESRQHRQSVTCITKFSPHPMHTRIHMYTHTHTHARTHVHTHTHSHASLTVIYHPGVDLDHNLHWRLILKTVRIRSQFKPPNRDNDLMSQVQIHHSQFSPPCCSVTSHHLFLFSNNVFKRVHTFGS